MSNTETEIGYPFAVSPSGDLVVTSDRPEQCRQAILSALYTLQGERVYRSDYGLASKVFTTNKVGIVLGQVRSALVAGIGEGYPDCTYQLTGVSRDDGRVLVVVTYQIANSNNTIQVPI